MTHLRFSPGEYHALCRACCPIKLDRKPLHILKWFLARSLAGTMPDLAQRIARLRRYELQILHDHLREHRQPEREHRLTREEFEMLAVEYGPFLLHARFVRPLRRALVEHFRGASSGLAAKLDQLNHRQFEVLCEQVQERTRRGT